MAITAALNKSALDLLYQLFKNMESGQTYFGFNGNSYQLLGTYSDGLLKALDLTTNQVTAQGALSAVNVVASNASTITGTSAASGAAASSSSGASGLQNLLSFGGTAGQLYFGFQQGSTSKKLATQQAAASAGAQGGPSLGSPEWWMTPTNGKSFDINSIGSLAQAKSAGIGINQAITSTNGQISQLNGQIGQGLDQLNKLSGGLPANFSLSDPASVDLARSFVGNQATADYLSNTGRDQANITILQNQIDQYQTAINDQIEAKFVTVPDFSHGGTTVLPIDQANNNVALMQNELTRNQLDLQKWDSTTPDAYAQAQQAKFDTGVSQIQNLQTQQLSIQQNLASLTASQPQINALADAFQGAQNSFTSFTGEQVTSSMDSQNPVIPQLSIDQAMHQIGAQRPGELDPAYADRVAAQINTDNRAAITSADYSNVAQAYQSQALQYLQDSGLSPSDIGLNAQDWSSLNLSQLQNATLQVHDVLMETGDFTQAPPSMQDMLMKKMQASVTQATNTANLATFKSDSIQLGAETVGAGVAAYKYVDYLTGLFSGDLPASFGNVAKAVLSAGGMALALHLMNGVITNMSKLLADGLKPTGILGSLFTGPIGSGVLKGLGFLTSPGGIAGLLGGLTLLAWWLGKKQISAEEQGAADMISAIAPVVWNDGPVVMLTAGIALAGLGINLSPSASNLPQIWTGPEATIMATLQSDAGGGIPSAPQLYGSVFVKAGQNGQPTRVVYVTPDGTYANGTPKDILHVLTLNGKYTFGTPSTSGAPTAPTSFIPIFIGLGAPNPQAVDAQDSQNAAGKCAISGQVNTMTAAQCAAAGGTYSHL